MGPGLLLAFLGLYIAWFPVETHASTPLVFSLGCALLLPITWRLSSRDLIFRSLCLLGPVFLLVLLQTLRSPDRCQGMQEIFLLIALCALFWFASLHAPSDRLLLFFALGLAGLAIWGLYQAGGGLEKLRPMIEQLPEASQPAALARITRARAFASLLLPSHLAVLLATALPILMERIRKDRAGFLALGGALLSLAGIAATRSPVGALLAVVAGAWVIVTRSQKNAARLGGWSLRVLFLILLSFALFLATLRPDVRQLEPLKIRVDNWNSALWIFSQEPFSGAGLGSFGHAVRLLPFPVANYPLHAHCLPLELMAELGIGGLFLWAFAMLLLLHLSWKLRPSAPGLAIAILIIPLHNLVDFSIFNSGLALPWVLLLAWAMARLPGRAPETAAPPIRWRAAAFAAMGLAIFLSLTHLSAVMLEEHTLEAGNGGISRLRRAAILAPWRSSPAETGAALALDEGDPSLLPAAGELLRDFYWQKPESAVRAQLQAHIEMGLGHPIQAAELLRKSAGQYFRDERRDNEYRNFLDRLKRAGNGAR